MKLHPTDVHFRPNSARVLVRPFIPEDPGKVANIMGRILALDEEAAAQQLEVAIADFEGRHSDLRAVWRNHFRKVEPVAREVAAAMGEGDPVIFSDVRQHLIGAYFSGEYALESAALFNPSMVAHPDQGGLREGELRFILSLRATGEGHISSIEFRTGVIHGDYTITVDEVSPFVTEPALVPDPTYLKTIFMEKLREMGFENDFTSIVIATLPDAFSLSDLQRAIGEATEGETELPYEVARTMDCIRWLAESNYEIHFRPSLPVSERILFPISSNESNGIEDARFVRFVHDDGTAVYYATYTAYNGHTILPQLLHTKDFSDFQILTLNGRSVQNKGMALFPRRINGCYAMISRQDDENILIMFSEHLHFWNDPQVLVTPREPWELMKIGNCGSPIETEAGWLLLTHGVGSMRKYCIGAVLLDRDDPTRVIGRLRDPIVMPQGNEREGYVPNVVYSCGGLIHGRRLILPYGMSDSAATIVTVELDELLEKLRQG